MAKKEKAFPYGPLTVFVKEEQPEEKIWAVRVVDSIGQEFEGFFQSPEHSAQLTARDVIRSLAIHLDDVLRRGRALTLKEARKPSYFLGVTKAEIEDVVVAFGEQIEEAYDVVKQIQTDYEKSIEEESEESLDGAHLGGNPKRVLDRNWREIKPGQKVVVQWPYYYVNVRTDEGIVDKIDEYGGVTIRTEQPVPHYDRHGFIVHSDPWIYFPASYDYDKKVYVAASMVGDPFEHGQIETFVEIVDGGLGLGGDRDKIECNFDCPGGEQQFPIWPRKGETTDETCNRGLRQRGLDDYQISLCKKRYHKRLN